MSKTHFDTSDKKVREIVLSKYDNKCSYCGCDISLNSFHIDHIDPLRRSKSPYKERDVRIGLNHINNYNPACKSCNLSKSCMDIETWRTELQLKAQRLHRDSSTFRLLKKYGIIKIVKEKITFYFETI